MAPITADDRATLPSITTPSLVIVGQHDFICGPLPPPGISAHTEGMGSRFLIWSGVAVAVAATVGLAALFAVAGLGRADEVASVSGAFIGLAGLGLSVYGLIQARSHAGPGPADGDDDDASRQAVSGSSVGGRTVQVSKAAGGVTVRPSPRPPVPPAATATAGATQAPAAPTAAAPTAAAPSAAAPTGAAPGAGYRPGQSVSDSRVGGDVVQIAGADGDVEIG